jgi:Zn-dependent peptidase ImmA (M78 family)
MMRVEVNRDLLQWAIERAGDRRAFLYEKFPKLDEWESGDSQPTLKQLEHFAKAAYVPIGYLFLPEPPEEKLPVPDLRTLESRGVTRPSPDLLDTIYAMQHRQAWLREDRIECEAEPLDFVGSARQSDNSAGIGQEMRRTVGLVDGWAANVRTWQESLGELRRAIEGIGVAVVVNGIVGNNTHRKLEVAEFRGFALSDVYAPLIFVNGSDAKSAQMFTLAHELAHIWLGKSALTNAGLADKSTHDIEAWCDGATAEFLVPGDELKTLWKEIGRADQPFRAAARAFKVSPIVAGRRAMDLGLVSRKAFFEFYKAYMEEEHRPQAAESGGDFYNTQNTRIGQAFALRVFRAAKEGRLSFKEAYALTGLHGGAFQEYARRLGVPLP